MTQNSLNVDSNFKSNLLYTTVTDSKWFHNAEYMINDGFPLQIDIDLNTTCNYDCIMCFRDFNIPKAGYMSLEHVYDLLDQCKEGNIESIKLNYRGEPLLYPHLIEVIKRAKEYGIYVHFNTNASLLTDEMAKALIFSGVDRVICSVESMFAHIYESIRRGGKFATILRNITRLHFLREIYNKTTPKIEILATHQELNKQELDDETFHAFWFLLVDGIQIAECFDLSEEIEDDTELPKWHCGQLWQRLMILTDGEVLPCCVGIDFVNNIIYSVGNVNENTLEEIWNSKKLEKLRTLHMNGESHKIEMCRRCRLRKSVIKKIKEDKNGS